MYRKSTIAVTLVQSRLSVSFLRTFLLGKKGKAVASVFMGNAFYEGVLKGLRHGDFADVWPKLSWN